MWEVEDDIAAREGEDPQVDLPKESVGRDDRPRSRCADDRSATAITVFLVWGGDGCPSVRTALFYYDRS